jgi:hypothetical protein
MDTNVPERQGVIVLARHWERKATRLLLGQYSSRYSLETTGGQLYEFIEAANPSAMTRVAPRLPAHIPIGTGTYRNSVGETVFEAPVREHANKKQTRKQISNPGIGRTWAQTLGPDITCRVLPRGAAINSLQRPYDSPTIAPDNSWILQE